MSPHCPVAVMLVSKDESAERVLFMYPARPEFPLAQGKYVEEEMESKMEEKEVTLGENSSYYEFDEHRERWPILGLPVKMLGPLLSNKGSNDEGAPFEIKVNNIRFAGFPWHIESCGSLSLAVVFILPGMADAHIVDAFQRLSRKIAIAINTEQQRCNYLREQIHLMQLAHDEFEALPDKQRKRRSPYENILERSGLAKHLREIFEDVCEYGMVDVFVDDCIEVGFCVEPGAFCHAGLTPCSFAHVEKIMARIRPYHGLLFLEDSVPSPDSNPFVLRFLDEYDPSRSIEELGLKSGLPMTQMLQIVHHYLLWARAVVIYPICSSNVYAVSAEIPTAALEAKFEKQFPDCLMAAILESFSPPCSLGSFLQDTAIYFGQPSVHISMLVFLLRNQLLIQLHTYFYLLPPVSNASQFFQNQQQRNGEEDNGIEEKIDQTTMTPMTECGETNQLSSLGARIRTFVSISKELNVHLKDFVLIICAKAIQLSGIPEPEMFVLTSTFISLAPFLDGRNHIEDIIYRTRLDRSTVMRVLDTFSELICSFCSQDLILEDEGDGGFTYPSCY